MATRTREAWQRTQQAALARAMTVKSTEPQYRGIFSGFKERGIPKGEIRPRENVFTFEAWKALGRHVRKGEQGVPVRIWSWIRPKIMRSTGEFRPGYRKLTTAVLFHVSQTDADEPHD